MGNWNRHFVRVGSDGNVGIFDNLGNENLEVVRQPAAHLNRVILQTPIDPNLYALELYEQNATNIGIGNDPTVGQGINQGLFTWYNFEYGSNLISINSYKNIPPSMNGFSWMSGTPDLRTGVTAADASPKTIFTSTASGTRYEVKARILATAGVSATYTISWTEGGAVRTVALTVTAAGTEVHDNFVIAPDSGTNITAQITSLTSSTVNVDAIVSVLG